MRLISITFLEFENVDFLPPARLHLLAKRNCFSAFVKIDTFINQMTLFLKKQMRFTNINFFYLPGPNFFES